MEQSGQAHGAASGAMRSPDLAQLFAFLQSYDATHPGASKDALGRATAEEFNLSKSGAVYVGGSFAS